MASCKVIGAVVAVAAALFWYQRKAQAETNAALLAQFLCVTNGLRPLYAQLQVNSLPLEDLRGLVQRCSSQKEVPELTSDGQFLSSFFVRSCGNFQEAPDWKRRGELPARSPSVQIVGTDVAFDRDAPARLQFSAADRERLLPQWIWDASVGKSFEEEIKTGGILGNKISAQPGFEQELAAFPLLTQNLTGKRGEGAIWRQQYDVEKAKQGLETILDYEPGKIWIEPEIWVQRAGAKTTFHYDYDPFNLVFQVHGSRRFHLLPPQSGLLYYDPEASVKDYGTRWARELFVNATTREVTVDLKPQDVLYIPNGWPHRVTYTGDSIGRAVRSWTQCQALSLYLGRRLCTLSTALGARLCFDDEHFREHGGLTMLEDVVPETSQ